MFVLFAVRPTVTKVSTLSTRSSRPYIVSNRLPYIVSGLADTSQGNLVMVKYEGRRTAVFSPLGQLKYDWNIKMPGGGWGMGVARRGQVLFISNYYGLIHVFQETGEHIVNIKTNVISLYGIAVDGDAIWITTKRQGLHKLVIDSDFNVVTSELFVPADPLSCVRMSGVTVHNSSLVIVLCYWSHRLKIFDITGTRVGGGSEYSQVAYPLDVVTDSQGFIYVANGQNNRITVFSLTGQFIKILIKKLIRLLALHIQNDTLYVVTWKPNTLYVIRPII